LKGQDRRTILNGDALGEGRFGFQEDRGHHR
jgi:hypothetical protein